MIAREFSMILILSGMLWSVSVHAQEPSSLPFYGDIDVTASGVKEHTNAPMSITAEVYINGRYVGKTPYSDGLPRGKYNIRVEAGGARNNFSVTVTPGERYEVKASLPVALTAEERAEIKRQQNAVIAAQMNDIGNFYQQSVDAWKVEDAEIRQRRKPLLVTSGILMGGGIGLTIAGAGFLAKYKSQKNSYEDALFDFELMTDPEEIELYRDYLGDLRIDKKRNKIFAAIFVPTGITSFIASLVLLGVAPPRPARPTVPENLKGFVSVRAMPFVAPGAGGMNIVGTF